jgi:hypothetical protein
LSSKIKSDGAPKLRRRQGDREVSRFSFVAICLTRPREQHARVPQNREFAPSAGWPGFRKYRQNPDPGAPKLLIFKGGPILKVANCRGLFSTMGETAAALMVGMNLAIHELTTPLNQ